MGKEELAQRFQRLLRETRITQRKLAKETGVAVSTINNWTAGVAPTDFVAVKAVAQVLGVSLSYLLTGENDVPVRRNLTIEDLFTDDGEIISGICEIKIRKLTLKNK